MMAEILSALQTQTPLGRAGVSVGLGPPYLVRDRTSEASKSTLASVSQPLELLQASKGQAKQAAVVIDETGRIRCSSAEWASNKNARNIGNAVHLEDLALRHGMNIKCFALGPEKPEPARLSCAVLRDKDEESLGRH